jgi:hypothetical protein
VRKTHTSRQVISEFKLRISKLEQDILLIKENISDIKELHQKVPGIKFEYPNGASGYVESIKPIDSCMIVNSSIKSNVIYIVLYTSIYVNGNEYKIRFGKNCYFTVFGAVKNGVRDFKLNYRRLKSIGVPRSLIDVIDHEIVRFFKDSYKSNQSNLSIDKAPTKIKMMAIM